MPIVTIAWLYVVVLMAVVEANSSTGTLLGAVITLLLYGVLPLALVLYLIATPARRRAQRSPPLAAPSRPDPDRSGHPARDAVAPEREEE